MKFTLDKKTTNELIALGDKLKQIRNLEYRVDELVRGVADDLQELLNGPFEVIMGDSAVETTRRSMVEAASADIDVSATVTENAPSGFEHEYILCVTETGQPLRIKVKK